MTSRGTRAFTLVEVAIAMTIATGGVIMLHQGITLALRAEEHRRVYQRVSRFLDQDLGAVIEAVNQGSGSSGEIPGPGPVVRYTVRPRLLDDLPGLIELEVTFHVQDKRLPDIPGFKTHHVPFLRSRKQEATRSGTDGES